MTRKSISVLIVDDSAVVRQVLTDVLAADADIRVLGAAADPQIAAQKIRQEVPDVIILDLEMPRMDGLTFLQKIMTQRPIPVVICSSLAERGTKEVFTALQYGAVEIIQKPKLGIKDFLEESRVRLIDSVKAAAAANLNPLVRQRSVPEPKLSADAVLARGKPAELFRTTEKVVVVGASTGGTEALRLFLQTLPLDAPGIVIVQHMPEHFTRTFAERLDSLCALSVKEAANGDSVIPGRVLIAPGNRHLVLKRSGARYHVEIKDGPLVNRHRPSVDVLFRSVARYGGQNAIGLILTGMGDDGARGLLEMKQAGALTFAQDEASSVVFGMPREAIRLGAVDRILPLEELAPAVLRAYRGSNGPAMKQ
jgi:two-component system chemotaxis response regulator CheB